MAREYKYTLAVILAIGAVGFALPEFRYYFKTGGIDREHLSHDDFVVLMKYGRQQDVEPLIAHLQLMDTGGQAADQKRIYSCTYLHCVDALKRITGVDNGMSGDQWSRWYARTYGRTVQAAENRGGSQ